MMFGLWDPSSAIPLNWSEGHVWTVEQVSKKKKKINVQDFFFLKQIDLVPCHCCQLGYTYWKINPFQIHTKRKYWKNLVATRPRSNFSDMGN